MTTCGFFMSDLQLKSSQRLCGGLHQQFTHTSRSNDCQMTFSIFLPPAAEAGEKVPVLYWLSGLTCTDENFSVKAGAQRFAAEHGIALVMPDTSPRGEGVPDDLDGDYAMGQGAGFYLNATQKPWNRHYKMYDYVSQELPALIEANFPVSDKRALSGHSMGGHGALVIGLRLPQRYQSVSAFAPLVNPIEMEVGQNAFYQYLGERLPAWQQYDATFLATQAKDKLPMLIDQGSDDDFLGEDTVLLENFEAACDGNDYPVTIRTQQGYNHSYFFVTSFIDEHIAFHAKHLKA